MGLQTVWVLIGVDRYDPEGIVQVLSVHTTEAGRDKALEWLKTKAIFKALRAETAILTA